VITKSNVADILTISFAQSDIVQVIV
ncbi:uncharacterized protein METZ01_LOCUS320464, partial [marine metagenome]